MSLPEGLKCSLFLNPTHHTTGPDMAYVLKSNPEATEFCPQLFGDKSLTVLDYGDPAENLSLQQCTLTVGQTHHGYRSCSDLMVQLMFQHATSKVVRDNAFAAQLAELLSVGAIRMVRRNLSLCGRYGFVATIGVPSYCSLNIVVQISSSLKMRQRLFPIGISLLNLKCDTIRI